MDVDVLLITGMRDEAPITAFSHLVPDSRLLEVRVQVSEETRQARRGCHGSEDNKRKKERKKDNNHGESNLAALDYCPSFTFENDTTGNKICQTLPFFPFFDDDLQRLTSMACPVPDFPRPGIEFRHVLNISQQPGGLALCTSLLQTHFVGDWAQVDVIACCEAGGFVYASALASRVDVPLVLILFADHVSLIRPVGLSIFFARP